MKDIVFDTNVSQKNYTTIGKCLVLDSPSFDLSQALPVDIIVQVCLLLDTKSILRLSLVNKSLNRGSHNLMCINVSSYQLACVVERIT
jgi:hypothetical protein